MMVVKNYSKRYSRSNNRKFYMTLMLFIMLFLGIGYAVINTDLTVNGSAKMHGNTWDVHFENIMEQSGSVSASEARIIDDTNIAISVELVEPGDFYSFTVDVVNNGTIDAMLSELLSTGLSTAQKEYIKYTATYLGGEEILEKDALPSGERETLLATVIYRDDVASDILPSEDENINLALDATYIQDDGTSTDRSPAVPTALLYNKIVEQNKENGVMVLDNQASTYVSATTGIDFNIAPSITNGNGVYIRGGTENDTYPIYYYRGGGTNNNVIFGDYCWKVVRTTETGGIKLVYNGKPKDDEENILLESSEYINLTNDATYAYTYDSPTKQWISTNKTDSSTGTISFSVATKGDYVINYVVSSQLDYDKAYFYLDGVEIGEYSGIASGSISLGEIDSTKVITVKYTKDSSAYSGTDIVSFSVGLKTGDVVKSCNNFSVYSQIGTSAFNRTTDNAYVGYMYGSTGSSYASTHSNRNNSTIKTYIDEWYEANMTEYTRYLEDTIWCNDRSLYTGSGTGTSYTRYGPGGRHSDSGTTVNLECVNQNDRFTVDEAMEGRVAGNGALTYPVALLTSDELALAGQGWNGDNVTNYLYTSRQWWSMSPALFSSNSLAHCVGDSGGIFSAAMNYAHGIRPSVSLKAGTRILDEGDGSIYSPFVVDVVKKTITIIGNDDITTNVYMNKAMVGSRVKLSSIIGNSLITSFKMNGQLIEGNSFIMPEEDVTITEVTTVVAAFIESEHEPYPNNLNDVVYGEKTFEGATSLTVVLDYQTESTNYDWIYLYDSATSTTPVNNKKYGGKTRTTETITINGNYIKIVFKTDDSGNNYYGFKATIIPNY